LCIVIRLGAVIIGLKGPDLAIVVLGTAFVLGARGLAELTQRLRYGNKVWKEQQQ